MIWRGGCIRARLLQRIKEAFDWVGDRQREA